MAIIVYETIPNEEIDASIPDIVKRCQEFFEANPDRDSALVGCWYGQNVDINKDSIEVDVKAAAEEAKK